MEALLIILVILVSFIIIALSISGYFLVKYLQKFPSIMGNKIKSVRGVMGRVQKEYDNLTRADFNHLVEENPVLLEMFPTSLPQAMKKDQQPQFLSSVFGLLGPALLNLAVGNPGGAVSGLDIGAIIPVVVQAFQALRANAKKTYKKPVPKEEEDEHSRKVHTVPKVESI